MLRYAILMLGTVFAVLAAAGCADTTAKSPQAVSSTKYHLDGEPAGALEVLDAKDQAKDGEPIVVVGRLGGGITPWIDGRAAFLLVDTRILPSCEEGEHCKADCADCAKEMLAACTMVKFLGHDGKVLQVDARQLLGVKEQETVVIKGVASRDKTGNVSIAAKGIYVRK